MKTPSPFYDLYNERAFSDKFEAMFGFITQNWKPLLKYGTFCVLLLCAILGYVQVEMMSDMTSNEQVLSKLQLRSQQEMLLVKFGIQFVCSFTATVFLYAVIFASMKMYLLNGKSISGTTFVEFRPFLLDSAKRVLPVLLFNVGLTILVFSACFVFLYLIIYHVFVSIIIFLLVLLLLLPLIIFQCVYVFEPISFWKALGRTFKLGFNHWGSLFVISFILLACVGAISSFAGLPSSLLGLLYRESGGSVLLFLSSFLATTFQYYIIFMLFIPVQVGLIYQYGSMATQDDSMEYVDNIDQAEKEMSEKSEESTR